MAWLIAAHRGPTIAMVTLSAVLAALIGAPVLLSALAVLAGQLSVGWQNDLIDYPRDLAVGRSAKPLVNGAIRRSHLQGAFVIAALCVTPLSLIAFGIRGTVAHVLAVLSAWSYNVYFKASRFSFLPYAISFALLPTTLYLATNRMPPLWLVGLGAVAGVVIHLLNAWPDIDEDLATGVLGLPQRLVAFARESSTRSDRSSQPRFAQWLRRRP